MVWQLAMVPVHLSGKTRAQATANAPRSDGIQKSHGGHAYRSDPSPHSSADARDPNSGCPRCTYYRVAFCGRSHPKMDLHLALLPVVCLSHQTIRPARCAASQSASGFHPELDSRARFHLYALPIFCSVLSHYALLYDIFFRTDDRTRTTQAALRFIELDFSAIGLTVLYWIAVEAEAKSRPHEHIPQPLLPGQEPGSASPGLPGNGS